MVVLGDVGEDGEAVRGVAGGHVLGVQELGDAQVFLGDAEGKLAVPATEIETYQFYIFNLMFNIDIYSRSLLISF